MSSNRTTLSYLSLLLLGAGLAVAPRPARGDVTLWSPSQHRIRVAASRLHSSDVSDPDTVWIGHVNSPTGLPGTPGGYGPYHVGRGPNRPNSPGGFNGVWDFDRFQAGETDSLQGWWPIALPFASIGSSNFPDRTRPFFGFDYGNQGNYVINQGNTAGKRTFGVTGYWHRDPGNNVPGLPDTGAVVAGPDVEWAPLAGGFSAWCGLRAHGDFSVVDAIANGGTGNAFNQSLLEYNGPNNGISAQQIGSTSTTGTDKNFPGYGSQWDQIIYRDVTLADGATLPVSFKYRTNLSTGKVTDTATRVGWYDKDPLKLVAAADGNFISASDAAATQSEPLDSFMVYIGVPVEPVTGASNDFVASDGVSYEIYDLKRRWFSEVIRIDQPYREILTRAGVVATTTLNQTIANTVIQPMLDAQAGAGGKVRIAFRVKTNRGSNDEDAFVSGFSSGTAGAAIFDDVVVAGWAAGNGDFESASSINNDPAVAATAAWKSTGKPPGIYWHSFDLAGFTFDDPCGAVTSPNRLCNMIGRVASPGDADNNEKPGGEFGANDQDRQRWFVSPTINLMSTGLGDYNGMGIDADIADATGDIALFQDAYFHVYQFSLTGNGFRWAFQSYPALQPNGAKCWGEPRKTITFFASSGRFCAQTFGQGMKADQLLMTSNASGVPDSIRAYIEALSRCFTQPDLTAATCSPTTGENAGGFFDNLSMAFIDAEPPAGIGVAVWDYYNDCFPANGNAGLPGTAAFDTLAAKIRTGHNISQDDGTPLRHNIPGDSLIAIGAGASVRMDLVFRILPGPGNYRTVGNRLSGLRKRPDGGGLIGNAVASGDGSFWGEYLASNGTFGSTLGHPAGTWSEHVWNSARMDTVEINFFPANGVSDNLGRLSPTQYASQYHESDPKYATLGVVKNRCFLVTNLAGSPTDASNITCGNGVYPPLWTSTAGSGYNSAEIAGQPGRTREYTQILPDGMFTPGSHVQYFIRKSKLATPTTFDMLPDTNRIFPQNDEGNFDGHRWQQFGVLPDRWKDQAFGGGGMACMLVVDAGDRRGDEITWISMADSIGLTAAGRRGAHNGWKARADQNIINVDIGSDDAIAVRTHGGQPGTVFDLYQVKAGESNVPAGRLGSRNASQANPGLALGKFSSHGPTSDMLRVYYRTLVWLNADLAETTLGPYASQSDDDIGLLTDFMTNPQGSATPRGVFMIGSDLVEGQQDPTIGGHPTFFTTFFAADFRDGNYRILGTNLKDIVDLTPVAPVNTTGGVYGAFNQCFVTNDVFTVNTAVSGAQAGAFYENRPSGGPFIASVYAPAGGSRSAVTLVDGWVFGAFGGLGGRYTLTTPGTRHFWLQTLTNMFAALNCGPTAGQPVGVGDDWNTGGTFVNFMNLRSSNPMRSGEARIAFGIAKTEKVEVRIYDVSGRLVKTVANRTFQGGQEHVVTWDGTNDAGNTVARGVYFYQLRSPSFTSQKKLAVLKN